MRSHFFNLALAISLVVSLALSASPECPVEQLDPHWVPPLRARVALRQVPQLRTMILELLKDPKLSPEVHDTLLHALNDEKIEVVKVNEALRKAWGIPDDARAVATHQGSNYGFFRAYPKMRTANEKATEAMKDAPRPRHNYRIAVGERPASAEVNDLLSLVHELAHVKMEQYLRDHAEQLARDLPGNLVRRDEKGQIAFNVQFIDLVHERFAHEIEAKANRAAQGRFFDPAHSKFPTEVLSATDETLAQEITTQVIDDYSINDPQVLAIARLPLQTLLSGDAPQMKTMKAVDARVPELARFTNPRQFELGYALARSALAASDPSIPPSSVYEIASTAHWFRSDFEGGKNVREIVDVLRRRFKDLPESSRKLEELVKDEPLKSLLADKSS